MVFGRDAGKRLGLIAVLLEVVLSDLGKDTGEPSFNILFFLAIAGAQ